MALIENVKHKISLRMLMIGNVKHKILLRMPLIGNGLQKIKNLLQNVTIIEATN